MPESKTVHAEAGEQLCVLLSPTLCVWRQEDSSVFCSVQHCACGGRRTALCPAQSNTACAEAGGQLCVLLSTGLEFRSSGLQSSCLHRRDHPMAPVGALSVLNVGVSGRHLHIFRDIFSRNHLSKDCLTAGSGSELLELFSLLPCQESLTSRVSGFEEHTRIPLVTTKHRKLGKNNREQVCQG